MIRIRFLLVLASLTLARLASAETLDYVQVGQAAVSGFRCAVLAAHARYANEEKRLLAFGLSKARTFIQASRAKQVSTEDFNHSEFVLPVVLRAWNFAELDVPVDFAAGQVYQSIWEQTTADLGNSSKQTSDSQKDYSDQGREKYRTQNCAFLGK
jgi:hypothetical protein